MNRTLLRVCRILALGALGLLALTGCALIGKGPRQPAAVEWSAWIGGGDEDAVNGLAVDGDGYCYLTGRTRSPGWTERGLDTSFNGDQDGFVAKVAKDGSLVWSTYLGGDADDSGSGVAVGSDGTVYVVGETKSLEWAGASHTETAHHGKTDAFVAAISGDGQKMLWSACVGTDDDEVGYGICLDENNAVFITGSTKPPTPPSTYDAPQTGRTQRVPPNVFVSKIEEGRIAWTTFMGGDKEDVGRGVGVDAKGNVYAAGWTDSPAWTLNEGIALEHHGARDAFVARLSSSGKLVQVACVGGEAMDMAYCLAVDPEGYSHVAGRTNSKGWLSGGFDTEQNGPWDAMAAKISPSGATVWSTCVGGKSIDLARAVSLDRQGNVYVGGVTKSSDPWLLRGPDLVYDGDLEGFVVKVAANGSKMIWGSYVGGSDQDLGYGVGTDNRGGVYVGGMSQDSDWIRGGFDSTYNGGRFDGYVARIRE
ncbi:SBBP repeat-containing protein [Candidatus Sumerlaeota bacterium]|nr:SBBP repeat-containing protein [Candidatus Sumerlaeota bacterium]